MRPALTRAGAGLLAASLAVLVAVVVSRHGAPLGGDVIVHRWVLQHRDRTATAVAIALTTTGTGAPAYALAALAGVLAAPVRRWWRDALVAVAALAVGQAIRLGLATVIGRHRPPMSDWAWHAGGPALPSGHTTTSALVAALLCVALRGHSRHRIVRAVAASAAVLWAVGVAVTRVYLGVHWPSDVLAGWLLAGALAVTAPRLLQVAAMTTSRSQPWL